MKKKFLSSIRVGVAVLFAVLATNFVPVASALAATPNTSDQNHTSYWENLGYGTCTKVENPGGSKYKLGTPPAGKYWTVLVVKASTEKEVYTNPQVGIYYNAPVGPHNQPREISHVIFCSKPLPLIPVTAGDVTFVDSCGTADDKYTVPVTPHVTYSATAGVHAGTGTVTVMATADTGYVLTTPYTFTHTFDATACPVVLVPVTAAAVTYVDVCGITTDKYTVPVTPHVTYSVAAGEYVASGTVTVMATADTGYVLTTPYTFTHTFDATACPVVDVCPNLPGDQSSLPDGMVLDRHGKCIVKPCNYHHDNSHHQSPPSIHTMLSVAGQSNNSYKPHHWPPYNHDCQPPHLPKEVTPAAPTQTPATCDKLGSYTIPVTKGVQYKVNGVNTAAGTVLNVQNGTDIEITAVALAGYKLTGSASWIFTFKTPAGGCVLTDTDVCPNIAGSQATVPAGTMKAPNGDCLTVGGSGGNPAVPTGHVLGAITTAPVLANTGENSSPLVNILVGMTIVGMALGTAVLTRKQEA